MNPEEQMRQAAELMAKLMVISEQMIKRGAELDQRSASVEQSLLRTERNVKINLDNAEAHLRQVTEKTVAAAVKSPTQTFEHDIKNITNELTRTASDVRKLQQETAKWLKALVWKALAGLTLASVITVVGVSYIAWDRVQVIKNANFGKEILDATKSGAINLCEGKLCVRLDKNAQRFGAKNEYVFIGQ